MARSREWGNSIEIENLCAGDREWGIMQIKLWAKCKINYINIHQCVYVMIIEKKSGGGDGSRSLVKEHKIDSS